MAARVAPAPASLTENEQYRADHPGVNWAEVNAHMGTAWKHDPKEKQTFFPMPWQQRGRNSRVPKLTINATRGFKSNGFVRPQTKRNSTLNTRRRTFEDNFIKRMIQIVEDSMLRDVPINLQEYADRLLAPDCSRAEAIVIYDELIAIFIILMLYIVYVLKDIMEKLEVNPSLNPNKMIISFDKAKIFGNIGSTLGISSLASIPTFMFIGPLIASAGTGGISIVIMIGIIALLAGTSVIFGVKMLQHREIYNKEKNNLLFVIQSIFNTIIDNRNTIKIGLVKDEIKYWGLTKAQVDYLLVPDNNNPRAILTDTTEYPQLPSAKELGINENEHEQLVIARENSIRLQRITNNEEYQKRGYTVIDVEVIKEFFLKAGENKEVLAPNGLFSNSVVKFGKRNDPDRRVQEYNYDKIMNAAYAKQHPTPANTGVTGGKRLSMRKTNKGKTHKRRK
jgi:hypothetical protein